MQNLYGLTRKEIIEKLSTIKEICERNSCDSCPFGEGAGGCSITSTSPDGWEFHEEDSVWRAFV